MKVIKSIVSCFDAVIIQQINYRLCYRLFIVIYLIFLGRILDDVSKVIIFHYSIKSIKIIITWWLTEGGC